MGLLCTAPFREKGHWYNETLARKVYSQASQLDTLLGQWPSQDTGSTILAAMKALRQAADTVAALKAAGASNAAVAEVLGAISESTTDLKSSLDCLIRTLSGADEVHGSVLEHATYFRDQVIPCMNTVRAAADRLEGIVDASIWPFPTYADLLFRV